ncbi:hypothetical protein FRB94_005792 [Tulasnella sp. JGI-2019a]|nr:hypothetical protein FRB94_005792 [Tulasnella sp. JGI-2019a]
MHHLRVLNDSGLVHPDTIIDDEGAVFITPSCAHCGAKEGHGPFLKPCKACTEVWYCDVECQRANWRLHKPVCRTYCEARAKDEKRMEALDALVVWAQRYERALNQAGAEVLLPSKSHPTRNLLLTSALELNVAPVATRGSDSGSSSSYANFEVISARTIPLKHIKLALDHATPGKFDGQNAKALLSPAGLEARKGKGVAGIMRVMMNCNDPGLIATHLTVISKEVVERRRMMENQERWEDQLKAFTAPGVRNYEIGEDGLLVAVKKLRTRRPKSKRRMPRDHSEGPQNVSPTASSPSMPRWIDLVEADDGELPDLSSWL